MDDILLKLDEHDRNPSVDISTRDSYRIRRAVRAVVIDDNGAIPLLHAGVRDYYKLPGGGVDESENLLAALARELKEEIGSTANITHELGQVLEWRDSERMKQISYCYMATLSGNKGIPDFTDKEIREGFEVVWVMDIERAINLVAENSDSEDLEVSFMTTRDSAILRTAAQKLK